MRSVALCLGMLMSCAHAMSLGVVGEVFMVEEESLITLIESKVEQLERTGELEAIQTEWVRKVDKNTNHPKPLQLKRTKKTTHHHYSPSIVLQQDVLDEKGHVLFPQGLKVNALDSMSTYAPYWLFFNADDRAQLHWAKQQLLNMPTAKVILTGGFIEKTEDFLKTPVYFDQGGRITRQLGIESVPAVVSRKKNRLLIEEIAIGEDGHAR